MGFNFRKSFKIAPGVRLNVGKKGVSSVSVGGKRARVTANKKGLRSSISAPGTGMSYSKFSAYNNSKSVNKAQQTKWNKPTIIFVGLVFGFLLFLITFYN